MAKTFGCMLAKPYKDASKSMKTWRATQAEPKMDGMRIRLFRKDGQTSAWSRPSIKLPNGSDYSGSLQHILEALPKDFDNFMADGELFTGSWGETMTLARTMNVPDDERQRLKVVLFDFIDLEEMEKNGRDNTPLYQRREIVEDVAGRSGGVIVPVEAKITTDPDEIDRYYRECLDKGFEGLVLKNPDSPYVAVRSGAWVKMKPLDTSEGIVTGFEEGERYHEGRLGACVLDWNGVKIKCGGGYRDKQRDWIWQHQKQVLGAPLEFLYQPDNVAKARFLRFKRFRIDQMDDPSKMAGFPA